ncbi:hypothetical protein K8R32_03835 [bacterium]|nr:hypothetical protein [bacterium]
MTLRKYIYLGLCVGFLVISYSLAYFEAIGLFSGIGIIKSIIYQYQFVFSSWYLLDVNIGFVNDITYLFEYIPYYIVIGLLVWSLRINKQMYTNYNKEIIN